MRPGGHGTDRETAPGFRELPRMTQTAAWFIIMSLIIRPASERERRHLRRLKGETPERGTGGRRGREGGLASARPLQGIAMQNNKIITTTTTTTATATATATAATTTTTTIKNNNNYNTFPVRGVGVYLDQIVNK